MKTTHMGTKGFHNPPLKCVDVTGNFIDSSGAGRKDLSDPFKITSSNFQEVTVLGLFTKIEDGQLKFLITEEVQYYPGGAAETVRKLPGAKVKEGQNWMDAFMERMQEKLEIKPRKCKIGFIGSFPNTDTKSSKSILKIFVAVRGFKGNLISNGKGNIVSADWKTYDELEPTLVKSQKTNFDDYLNGVTKLHRKFAFLAYELQTRISEDRSAKDLAKQHKNDKAA